MIGNVGHGGRARRHARARGAPRAAGRGRAPGEAPRRAAREPAGGVAAAGERPALSAVRSTCRSFIEEVADTLRFRAPGRVVRPGVAGQPEIVTDRTLLYRVLYNLGDNALKYSDGHGDDHGARGGRRRRSGSRWWTAGSDRAGQGPAGVGAVSQVEPSDPRKVGGVGLGLHLVRKATEALGGGIHVDGWPGAGSTFSVWLRRSSPRRANRRPDRRASPPATASSPSK